MAVSSKFASNDSDTLDTGASRQNLLMISKFWEKAQPHLAQVRPFLNKILPVLTEAGSKATNVARDVILPHYNDEIGKVMWNVILVFFGGQFALTIMALQAFKMTGSVMIQKSVSQLRESYHEAMIKLRSDPEARALMDETNGEISLEDVGGAVFSLVAGGENVGRSRRIVSVCLRCIDPNKLLDSLSGFLVGSMAILAILRSQVAKCVSIGAQIGTHITSFIRVRAEKDLFERYPQHKNWVDVGLRSGSALIGIIISFMLIKVVNSFNCALQGAESLSKKALDFAHKRGKLLSVKPNDTAVQSLTMAVVFVGVAWQVRSKFNCPWYLKLFLLPAVVSENLLGILAIV